MDISGILNGSPEAKWYKVPGAKNVKIQIRSMKPKRRRDLVKECTTRRLRTGQYVQFLDEDRLNDLILDEVVLAWEGIEHNDAPFECTLENKKVLDANWSEFNALWNAVVGVESALEDALQEAELGNSTSGADSI